MKKKLLFVFSILLFCTVCFFGCGVAPLSGGPSLDSAVYGNGGFSVIKGDYLYFSNAYADYNELREGENKYDFNSSKKVYGIYRVKLNDNKLVNLDEDGFPIGAELMVPQIGAYSYSGLYICNGYLYYTTPFTGNKSGTMVKGLITFERVKLDRTAHKVLYKMEDYSSSCKYSINFINGVAYITILDVNSNVTLLTVNGENIQSKHIASGVTSVFTSEQTEISSNNTIEDNDKYIYYMKKDGNYYSLYRKSMLNPKNGEQTLIENTLNEIDILKVKNARIYYKEDGIIKSLSIKNNEEPKVYTNQKIAGDDENGIKSFYVLNDSNGARVDRGIACVSYDGTNYIVNIYNGTSQFLMQKSNQITILYENNNILYYKVAEDEALYCINITSLEENKICKQFLTSTSDEENSVYDFDLYHGFYFNTVEGANNSIKYLHMVDLNGNGYLDEDSEKIGHYIGMLDASQIK